MKSQNANIEANKFNSELFNLIKQHSAFKGNIDSNFSTIKMTASFEDFETGEFDEAIIIAEPASKNYNEEELQNFFDLLKEEEFEVKETTDDSMTSLIFGSPEVVYVVKIQNIYK